MPEFVPNLLNIDTSYAIICLESEPVIYLSYFNHSNAVRCSESIVRKFKITKPNDHQIYLITQNDYNDNDKIMDFYNSILYDEETEELRKCFENNDLIYPDCLNSNFKMLFENNLMNYTFFQSETNNNESNILIDFYQFSVENVKSTHPIFSNMCLQLTIDSKIYYYSEIQNYNICCGGGEYSFIQFENYESARAYDFWKERIIH